MSPNEEYVLEVLKNEYGGHYIEGEDPPDAYLFLDGNRIAVEVTRLVEQVRNDSGEVVSRMTHDVPAMSLAKKIDAEMIEHIPDGKYVLIIVPAPVKSIRRTKELIKSEILQCLENGLSERDVVIESNRISIHVHDGDRPSGKKVIGAVSNRYSSANISENAANILYDRISSKAKKCFKQAEASEYWLALYNDYWVADANSYRQAYKSLGIEHNFNKVLVVNGYGEVHCL